MPRRCEVDAPSALVRSGGYAAMYGEFTILTYPETADPDVVFIENAGGTSTSRSPT